MGRYSFRRDGRWIGEDSCDPATTVPPMLWLTEDSTDGPKPPANFEFDAAVLNKKFAVTDAPHLARQVPLRQSGV